MGFHVEWYSLSVQTLMGLSTVLFTSKLHVKMIYGDTFQILNLFWLKVHFFNFYSLPNLNISHHKC